MTQEFKADDVVVCVKPDVGLSQFGVYTVLEAPSPGGLLQVMNDKGKKARYYASRFVLKEISDKYNNLDLVTTMNSQSMTKPNPDLKAMARSFRVGDIVVCVRCGLSDAGLTKGNLYSVVKIASDMITVVNDKGNKCQYFASRFDRPIEKKEAKLMSTIFKRGDIVKVQDSNFNRDAKDWLDIGATYHVEEVDGITGNVRINSKKGLQYFGSMRFELATRPPDPTDESFTRGATMQQLEEVQKKLLDRVAALEKQLADVCDLIKKPAPPVPHEGILRATGHMKK